jgi:hypothetical protein
VAGGQDNVVGTATCYRLDSLGFEPQWRQGIFSPPYPSRLALGSTQLLTLSRGKAAGCDIHHPPPSNTKNQYTYTSTLLLCFQWHVMGFIFSNNVADVQICDLPSATNTTVIKVTTISIITIVMKVTTAPSTNFQGLTNVDQLYINTTFSWAEK